MASDINGKPSPSTTETVHLRAYIHCEGCKKKVNKILSKIEGVDTVEIEASIGKVTITGTADAKTVMKKLEKCGKVVQLWPGTSPLPIKVTSPILLAKNEMKPVAKDKEVGEKVGPQQPSSEKAATGSTATPNTCNGSPSKKKSTKLEKKKSDGEDAASSSAAKSGDKQSSGKAESEATPPNSKVKGPVHPNSDDGAATGNHAKAATPSSSGDGKAGKNCSEKEDRPGGLQEQGSGRPDTTTTTMTTSSTAASKHRRAPPPMVLVETSEYPSADMESTEADYATHMFSDENANNCTVM